MGLSLIKQPGWADPDEGAERTLIVLRLLGQQSTLPW